MMIKQILSMVFVCSVGLMSAQQKRAEVPTCNDCEQACAGKEAYQAKGWYGDFLSVIGRENLIDSADAMMIKGLSSDSHIAFDEPWKQTIKRYGKIKEENILSICSLKNDSSVIYVMTQGPMYFCHLFLYRPASGQLLRVQNKGPIGITAGERLVIKSYSDSSMVFCTTNDETWVKYFYFNKKKNSLLHFKNCTTTHNQEKCNVLKNAE